MHSVRLLERCACRGVARSAHGTRITGNGRWTSGDRRNPLLSPSIRSKTTARGLVAAQSFRTLVGCEVLHDRDRQASRFLDPYRHPAIRTLRSGHEPAAFTLGNVGDLPTAATHR